MIKEWLIRKLNAVPAPEFGKLRLIQFGPTIFAEGNINDILNALNAVPMPKPGEGQYVVRPTVKRNPIRKSKQNKLEL